MSAPAHSTRVRGSGLQTRVNAAADDEDGDGRTLDDGVRGELLDEAALLVCVEIEVEGMDGGEAGQEQREHEPHFG